MNWPVIAGVSLSMSSGGSQSVSLLTPDLSITSTSSVASSQSNIMGLSRPQAHHGVVTKVEPKEMETLNEDELVKLIKNFKKMDRKLQIFCGNFVFCLAYFL